LRLPVIFKQKQIDATSAEWPLFLDLTYTYIQENWPHATEGISKEGFLSSYADKLKKRLQEGPRSLFIYYSNETPVGLSNVYITSNDRIKILNIAELYVAPSFRSK